MNFSTFLPPLLSLNDCNGDWARFLDHLYGIFSRDFLQSQPAYQKTVKTKYYPEVPHEKYKHSTFWHLISEGKVECDREPALDRCERLGWIRPIIENSEKSEFRIWEETNHGGRGENKRILISLEDFSYLVILEDRGSFVLLWTAYPVSPEHSRRKLKNRFEEYLKKLGSP